MKAKEKKQLCQCGTFLVGKAAKDVKSMSKNQSRSVENGSYIICNQCNAKVDGLTIVYNCPGGSNKTHPHGYTLCYQCFDSRS